MKETETKLIVLRVSIDILSSSWLYCCLSSFNRKLHKEKRICPHLFI